MQTEKTFTVVRQDGTQEEVVAGRPGPAVKLFKGEEVSAETYKSLGGMSAGPDPIPAAGAGPTLEGDTRMLRNGPQRFPATVGGRGVKPIEPYANRELGEAGDASVRVGDNWLMSPVNSGIAEPLDFRAPQPGPLPTEKREGVSFADALLGPLPGTNRYDAPRVSKSEKRLGDGLYSDVVAPGWSGFDR